jgi:AcrR family transcriptional regulator
MMMASASAGVKVQRLRLAQRSFTRARICAAAREIFATQGFAGATMEQVAEASGTRRSTVYNHFRDKNEILLAIAEDFCEGSIELIRQLPAPLPSRADIDAWMRDVAVFTMRDQTPTVLLMNLGAAVEVPPALEEVGARLMGALAQRLPAFRRTLEPGPEQGLARARAQLVLQQIGWACLHLIRDKGKRAKGAVSGTHMLTVAAELFDRFVREGTL